MDLEFIENEMLTHIPINTHKEPTKILVINGGKRISNELAKYNFISEIINLNDTDTISELKNLGAKKFDVAIVATNKYSSNREFWIELTKLLEQDGVVSIMMSNIITDIENAKAELKLAGAIYPIVMPYRYESFKNGEVANSYLMLASRMYHPTADINLQRADLTDGFKYYNSDIAISCFSTPTFIYKEYLGIIKR